jgi:hypothetical protein
MSFNKRGGFDRRPDRQDRSDRPARREGGGDWQPRDRSGGGDRPYQPRGGMGRPGGPGGPGGGGRPYQPRPQFDRPPDEGAMSIRLDPRRVGVLKQLAADADQRPGDLVRQWVEERIDAARHGSPDAAPTGGVATRLNELAARIAALEAAAKGASQASKAPAAALDEQPQAERDQATESAAQPLPVPGSPAKRKPAHKVNAAPAGERVALHDEMIAVLRERGAMTAGELAGAIAERGRYAPPRSGKPLDAAMVSQRVSNPTYRSRFTRDQGRIGLAE